MPSTVTEALLDVNVLIAAVFVDHQMHAAGRAFVEALERFHTSPTTQGGFLRFATRAWKDTAGKQFPPRLSMQDGIRALQQLTGMTRHFFIPDDLQYAELPADLLRGSKQWTDAYLLHLCERNGVVLATFDARMAGMAAGSRLPILVLT